MIKNILWSITYFLVFSCANAFAIRFIASESNKVIEISSKEVRSYCRKNFVYRNVGRNELPSYLLSDSVKAALTGSVVSDYDTVIKRIKENPGLCSWLIDAEQLQ